LKYFVLPPFTKYGKKFFYSDFLSFLSEYAYSTLTESARCIKYELKLIDYSEIIIRAAQKYNLKIHSITNQRPFDILFK